MNATAVQSITDEQLAEIESMLACDPQGSIYTDANELGGLISRLRAAENKLRAWEPIMDEVDRRAGKECCLADRCDFTVTVCYDDYAAINATMQEQKP